MLQFERLTNEEAIRRTLREDKSAAGAILAAAPGDKVHLVTTIRYEVSAAYAKVVLADYARENARESAAQEGKSHG